MSAIHLMLKQTKKIKSPQTAKKVRAASWCSIHLLNMDILKIQQRLLLRDPQLQLCLINEILLLEILLGLIIQIMCREIFQSLPSLTHLIHRRNSSILLQILIIANQVCTKEILVTKLCYHNLLT